MFKFLISFGIFVCEVALKWLVMDYKVRLVFLNGSNFEKYFQYLNNTSILF